MKQAEDVEFFEHSWLSAFGLLLCQDVCRLDMTTMAPPAGGDPDLYARDLRSPPPSCTAPKLALEDLLRTVAGAGDGGRDDGLDRGEMTLRGFLNHVGHTVHDFETRHVGEYIRILDPAETAQPWEILQPRPPVKVDPKVPPKNPQEPRPRAR